MRFLHFSTSDGSGGAAKAAHRLHTALSSSGHCSQMLVRERTTSDSHVCAVQANRLAVQLRRLQRFFPWGSFAGARFTFNPDLETGIRLQRALAAVGSNVDAICLHWVANFLASPNMRAIYEHFRRPLLWVMMDQEPVTGGCHYSFGCPGYERQCGNCPLLERPSERDRSRQVFLRKRQNLADLPITFIAPTSWTEERVRRSALFGSHRIERIPLPIDTSVYCLGDRQAARNALGIPPEKHLILFGSSYLHEPRKGGAYLIEALTRLSRVLNEPGQPASGSNPLNNAARINPGDVLLVMAGQNGDHLKRQLPFPVRDLGFLRDERLLAAAYRAADLFVCTSIEDAGPMMIPEALLSGTPVVAFNTGGAPDLVATGETGYLARLGDAADLALGIGQVLASPTRAEMGQLGACRARRLHEPQNVVKQYANLVAELIDANPQFRAAA